MAGRLPASPPSSDQISASLELLDLVERLERQVAAEEWLLLASTLSELEAARDAMAPRTLRVALDQVCTSLRALLAGGGADAFTEEAVAGLRQAITGVRRALTTPASGPPRGKDRRFWE
jgi:hypothetical protein